MNNSITHSVPDTQEELCFWEEQDLTADDTDVLDISRRLMVKNRQAYEELAK